MWGGIYIYPLIDFYKRYKLLHINESNNEIEYINEIIKFIGDIDIDIENSLQLNDLINEHKNTSKYEYKFKSYFKECQIKIIDNETYLYECTFNDNSHYCSKINIHQDNFNISAIDKKILDNIINFIENWEIINSKQSLIQSINNNILKTIAKISWKFLLVYFIRVFYGMILVYYFNVNNIVDFIFSIFLLQVTSIIYCEFWDCIKSTQNNNTFNISYKEVIASMPNAVLFQLSLISLDPVELSILMSSGIFFRIVVYLILNYYPDYKSVYHKLNNQYRYIQILFCICLLIGGNMLLQLNNLSSSSQIYRKFGMYITLFLLICAAFQSNYIFEIFDNNMTDSIKLSKSKTVFLNYQLIWIFIIMCLIIFIMSLINGKFIYPTFNYLPFIFGLIYGPLIQYSYVDVIIKKCNTVDLNFMNNIANVLIVVLSYILGLRSFFYTDIPIILFMILIPSGYLSKIMIDIKNDTNTQ